MGFFDRFRQEKAISTSNELITFFDVETPNRHNDNICSIGVTQTDMKGNVVNSVSHLVNPEEPFDEICIRVHGICSADVRNAPTFPEVWRNELMPMFTGSYLVAHNATFDLSVIWKALSHFEIDIPPLKYACTLSMMRSRHPGMESYKLPAVCDFFNLPLGKHHDSLDDATACRNIFWAMVSESSALPNFEPYTYIEPRFRERKPSESRVSDTTKSLRIIKAIAESTVEDNEVSMEEADTLLAAFAALPDVAEDKTMQPILLLLQEAVADGHISTSESREITKALKYFIDPIASTSSKAIEVEGKNFILSGNFEHGSKDSVAAMIESKGGTMLKGVTKKCNYVVVGGCGNEMWSMDNYGSKVKKALDWQAKGVPIQIVTEEELFQYLA